MRKEKGFTLIELLAVIIILGIISLIVIPTILKTVEKAKMDTFKITAHNIAESGKMNYAAAMRKGEDGEVNFYYEDGIETSNKAGRKLNYEGKKPQNGIVKIYENGKVVFTIYDGTYCAYKTYSDSEIIINEISLEECDSLLSDESCFVFDSETGTIIDYDNDCSKKIVIPEFIEGEKVVAIGNSAFAYNQLTSVVMPDSVIIIGDSAFRSNQLTSVTIPDSVTTIGNSAFYNNQLISVTISDSITTIKDSTFEINQLTSVTIPNCVTTIGNSAFRSNQLTSVIIPDSVTTIGDYAFIYNQLISLTIGNSVITIGMSSFYSNQLVSVTIPNSVTTIGKSIFSYNPTLTTINVDSYNECYKSVNNAIYSKDGTILVHGTKGMANNIESTVTTIGDSAFYGMGLTSVTIPNSVTTIGTSAFRYNSIEQGNATIDNTEGNVSIGTKAFNCNGSDGVTIITPVYLR